MSCLGALYQTEIMGRLEDFQSLVFENIYFTSVFGGKSAGGCSRWWHNFKQACLRCFFSIAFAITKLGELKSTLQLEVEHFPNWPSRGFAMSGVKEARLQLVQTQAAIAMIGAKRQDYDYLKQMVVISANTCRAKGSYTRSLQKTTPLKGTTCCRCHLSIPAKQ